MTMTKRQIKYIITSSFRRYLKAPNKKRFDPIPKSLTDGKLYEAYILGVLLRELSQKEGFRFRLVAGKKLRLRSSPGPINRGFPHIKVFKANKYIAEIWTDIEFLTLSHALRGTPRKTEKGDYHELDILLLDPDLKDRPSFANIWLGIECKNTKYKKSLLKEILGVRREMSLLSDEHPTKFSSWPEVSIPANPPSCLLVYSAYNNVNEYDTAGRIFGITFLFEPM